MPLVCMSQSVNKGFVIIDYLTFLTFKKAMGNEYSLLILPCLPSSPCPSLSILGPVESPAFLQKVLHFLSFLLIFRV